MSDFRASMAAFEKSLLQSALLDACGDYREAAHSLCLSRQIFRALARKHKLAVVREAYPNAMAETCILGRHGECAVTGCGCVCHELKANE